MLRAISFCLISMLTCATDTLFAQENKPTSGTDVIVSPTSGNYYSQARVSVSYDSTIYIGRLYRAGGPGSPQNMEVLKTTDYGQNFTVATSAAVTGSTRYSNMDIITAGAGPGNFRLFVAYSTYDTATDNVVLRLDTLDENGNGGAMINELYVQTNNPFFRGVESISLATDWREPAASSSSFAVTMAVAKVGPIFDSVVVFTSSTEGPGYTRQPLQTR